MLRKAALIVSVGVVYFAAAKLGLSMAFVAEQVSLVWPPAGIALFCVLRFGYRVWPAIALGAFTANATANEPLGTAFAIALGNTMEALAGAWLLGRTGFDPRFERLRDVLDFIAVAVLVAPVVAATIGVLGLILGAVQPWPRFGVLWRVWWMGDAMGSLIVAPPLLVWTHWRGRAFSPLRILEAAAIVVALAAVCAVLFAGWRAPMRNEPLEYVVFPFVIWAALRFSQLGNTLVVLLVSVTAVWGTLQGFGPFTMERANEGLFLLHAFLAFVALTGLTLAATSSERNAAERKLRDSHAVLESISNGTTDALFVKDREGRYLMINPAGARFIGKPVEEIMGKDDLSLFSPESAVEVMKRDRRVMEEGRTATYEEPGTAAGVTRTYLTTKGPYRDEEGRVIGLIGISRDISARKEMESALRESEARYRSLVLASAQMVWTTTAEGEVVRDFPVWRELTGQSAEEMKGRGWMERIHPEDRERIENLWSECLAKGIALVGEFRLRTRGGAYRNFLARAVPVRDEEGKVHEWVGALSDVTDQKHAEEERDRLLEREQALRAAADESNRQKDEFLSLLGHELRNPLAPIRNAIEILQRDQRPEMLPWALQIMSRQVHHMTRLVDDLLDVSRITSGRIELRSAREDLRTLVQGAVTAVRPLVDSRSHALELSLPHEPVPVVGDPTRLEQVFVNVLNNAAKYTEPGGRIWVSVTKEESHALVRVRDSGRGIPSSLLPRLFDLFTQADRSLARSEGGLGVGLSLVRKLVELHHGSVEASSAGAGLGSEILIRLPLDNLPREEPAGAPTSQPSRRRPLRVLVVEDNRDSAESMSMLLELLGHEVRTALDGPAALEVDAGFHPDVVLLDIGLPGMDGYEVARHLRSRGGTATLISLTGYGRESDKRKSIEAGFDHQLVKPVEAEALKQLFATL